MELASEYSATSLMTELLELLNALAMTRETDPDWPELAGIFLALRMIQTVMSEGYVTPQARYFAIEQARLVINANRKGSLISLINIIAERATSSAEDWERVVVARLFGTAIALRLRGHAAASTDLFAMVRRIAGPEAEISRRATRERGFAFRIVQRFGESEREYDLLVATAKRAGDRFSQLEGELGLAKVRLEMGDLVAGSRMVHAVLEKARSWREQAIECRALVDCAYIAGVEERPSDVLAHSYQALQLADEPKLRERLLINVAFAFRELGRPADSRSLAERVLQNGLEVEQNINAQILLYHLAIDEADWEAAAKSRHVLAALRMPPRIAAEYYQAVAREHASNKRMASALMTLSKIAAIAEEHGLAELLVRTEVASEDLRRGIIPAVYHYRPRPPEHAAQRALLESISARIAHYAA